MKKYFIIIFLLIATQIEAQEDQKRFDIRFGGGISLLGTGDMTSVEFENEVNYRINQYFGSSFTLNYGRSNSGVYETSSFIQVNLNAFISPFKNSRKNDFRIGAGFSVMNVADSYYFGRECGLSPPSTYQYDKRSSFGYNIIIEDTYSIKDKYLIGLKLFTQPYTNGDINSGILLKLGLRL